MPAVTRTDEGYLRGTAIVTRAGVFHYLNADGSVRSELRHPDDVFAADSLATLSMIPITVDHPSFMVGADNVAGVAVGTTGEIARTDGGNVLSSLTITGKRGIEAVEQGKRELSLGYRVTLDEETGVYDGVSFTHRQRNIRYNHLAIVDVARAGKAARLNIDGLSVPIEIKELPGAMSKIRIDGIEYDAAPEVVNAMSRAEAKAADMQAKLDASEAAHVAAISEQQAKLDAATADLVAAKAKLDSEDARVAAAVKARLALVTVASGFVKADMADMPDRAIKEAVIATRYPDFKADGRDDVYIQARFDGVIESKTADAATATVTKLADKRDGAVAGSADKARADAIAAIAAMHKTKEA